MNTPGKNADIDDVNLDLIGCGVLEPLDDELEDILGSVGSVGSVGSLSVSDLLSDRNDEVVGVEECFREQNVFFGCGFEEVSLCVIRVSLQDYFAPTVGRYGTMVPRRNGVPVVGMISPLEYTGSSSFKGDLVPPVPFDCVDGVLKSLWEYACVCEGLLSSGYERKSRFVMVPLCLSLTPVLSSGLLDLDRENGGNDESTLMRYHCLMMDLVKKASVCVCGTKMPFPPFSFVPVVSLEAIAPDSCTDLVALCYVKNVSLWVNSLREVVCRYYAWLYWAYVTRGKNCEPVGPLFSRCNITCVKVRPLYGALCTTGSGSGSGSVSVVWVIDLYDGAGPFKFVECAKLPFTPSRFWMCGDDSRSKKNKTKSDTCIPAGCTRVRAPPESLYSLVVCFI